jgi:hypothetical protein
MLTRNFQLGARTETEKAGVFTNKKVQVVAGTTDKLFCEGKTPEFYVESRDPTENSGLNLDKGRLFKTKNLPGAGLEPARALGSRHFKCRVSAVPPPGLNCFSLAFYFSRDALV